MNALRIHLRNKFLAGGLAAGPLVILALAARWLEENTKLLTQPLGFHFPGLGVLLALAGVYLLGLVVTSLVGRFFLRLLDSLLQRVPGLNLLYRAWKDILVLPVGKTGVFHRVVLVPAAEGRGVQLGFTDGTPLPGAIEKLSIFVPGVPNPLSGQLVVVERSACRELEVSVEEAFKYLLSTGNYVPAGLTQVSEAS